MPYYLLKRGNFFFLMMTVGFIKLVKDIEEDGVEGQSNLEIVHCLQFTIVMVLVSVTK